MTGWKRIAAIALLLAAAGGTATSGATYTAFSKNPQAFAAAGDFGVHVTMIDPGSPLRGTVSLGATATETAGGSITSVVIERSPAGSNTWTTVCTDNLTPFSCSLDTTTLTNGQYDFRARATNNTAYTRISTTVSARVVDNAAPTVTMTDPGAWFPGTVTLASTAADTGGSGMASVRYEYRTSAGGTWTTACTGSTAPYSCSFVATALTNGTNYDFRAIATDGAGNTTTSTALVNKRPDKLAPTGTTTDPGSPLRGTVTVNASPADTHSGVASVRIQYSAAGAGSWNDICTDTTPTPYSCAWNTTTVTGGSYDLRTIVTDVAGNTYNTPTIASRVVDNTGPVASVVDPGSPISGTVNLNATATDTGGTGVASVRIQYSAAGTGAWADVCTDTISPYSCSVNTTGAADGLYDFRAIVTDVAGNVTTTSTIANRRVDNVAPSAADVQTSDPGGLNGIMEPGDAMTLTYSEAMAPSSIIAGWDGTGTQAVTVQVNQNTTNDRVLFFNAANTTRLPLTGVNGVTLGADHVTANMTWTGTLSHNGASFTVTLNAIGSGSIIGTATPNALLSWTPDAGALDLGGRAATTAVRTELGVADPNF